MTTRSAPGQCSPVATDPDPCAGYKNLVAAFLQRLVLDASQERPGPTTYTAEQRRTLRAQARAFLRDDAAMQFWVGLADADPEVIIPQLRRAAKLPEDGAGDRTSLHPHRQGEMQAGCANDEERSPYA